MIPFRTDSQESRLVTHITHVTQSVREHEVVTEEPRPWTAPDFVEQSVCAEIGAYSFQER